ncbi:hypothetical protein MTR67_047431 [Solanum verrucosum]|uniref:Uncharacterized protein n=1 Tax=Solanum verrucosum TaxID=315347 RepID=A0AAF0ZWI0_SOLVR|nr:hypothetical protein MTR67_047431 [Solanum verrucosum]
MSKKRRFIKDGTLEELSLRVCFDIRKEFYVNIQYVYKNDLLKMRQVEWSMEVDINPGKIDEHFNYPGQNELDYEVVDAPICDLMQKLIRR